MFDFERRTNIECPNCHRGYLYSTEWIGGQVTLRCRLCPFEIDRPQGGFWRP